ncbi:MAG: hypothetical protein V1897_18840, partial [Pseudomonadota bacterium]
IKKISNVSVRIENLQKELKNYEAVVLEHADLLEQQEETERKIEMLELGKNKILNEKKTLTGLLVKRNELLKTLIETVLAQKNKYDEIIKSFSSEKYDVLLDLDFTAEIDFDYQRLQRLASEILDGRKVSVYDESGQPEILRSLIQLYQDVLTKGMSTINEIVNEIVRLTGDLKGKIRPSETFTYNQLFDCLWGNYMSVSPCVKYKSIPLDKLSLGQKASVLIKIYLAQGTKPIIIDSHDDYLDNESIMDELVKALRQAKSYRQIILVSNNGNVVVNSDAEQVIIAQHTNQTISYTSGSIENPSIREKALRVLEGGRKAFEDRQKKYRITG